MIVLISVIILFIIYTLSGKGPTQQSKIADTVNIIPKIDEIPTQQQPAQPPQPTIKKGKTVRFTPVINVRTFNVNDGEIVEQYARQI